MHVQMRETLRWILWALGLLLCVQCAWCQRPEKGTLCEIKDKPMLYDHKLLEVEGFVSHDFEDSQSRRRNVLTVRRSGWSTEASASLQRFIAAAEARNERVRNNWKWKESQCPSSKISYSENSTS